MVLTGGWDEEGRVVLVVFGEKASRTVGEERVGVESRRPGHARVPILGEGGSEGGHGGEVSRQLFGFVEQDVVDEERGRAVGGGLRERGDVHHVSAQSNLGKQDKYMDGWMDG